MIDLAGDLTRIENKVDLLVADAALCHSELHTTQLTYPELDIPVTLPAEGNPWQYGALTEVIPIATIGSDFTIHYVSVSGMSANASFSGKITYGAGDTMWAYFSITRGGAQISSALIPIQGIVIPANSVGTSTLAIKLFYHIEPS